MRHSSRCAPRGHLTINPCDGVDLPTIHITEPDILSEEDLNRMILCALNETNQMHAIIPLLLITGLRRGELLGLHWDDIDLEKGTLRVERSVNVVDGQLRALPTKTDSSERTLSLTPLVIRR